MITYYVRLPFPSLCFTLPPYPKSTSTLSFFCPHHFSSHFTLLHFFLSEHVWFLNLEIFCWQVCPSTLQECLCSFFQHFFFAVVPDLLITD
ncbi:hypothetical protein ES332_D11G386500v1 [Gossypium tomentosum]|uniref:Uncharacterized protein n=1 Tax=Gossypium tomentosum TaxID=34277 RepID=A0A5D2IXF9_GOSTO|nr:hypothetical protein ES332_D11G386500v1 [Gossypium tomentosum]